MGCMNGFRPLCHITVGALAAVGAVTVVMMLTERGRNIIKNLDDCVCHCKKSVGDAAECVKEEVVSCFCDDGDTTEE